MISRKLFSRSLRKLLLLLPEQCTIAHLADISLNYYITMYRGDSQVDYSSQMPAVCLVETLGKKVRNRLAEG